jgi:hypothetical protein
MRTYDCFRYMSITSSKLCISKGTSRSFEGRRAKTAFDLSVDEAYGVSPNAARYDLPAVMPPSITKPEPAMYLDSSDAR